MYYVIEFTITTWGFSEKWCDDQHTFASDVYLDSLTRSATRSAASIRLVAELLTYRIVLAPPLVFKGGRWMANDIRA